MQIKRKLEAITNEGLVTGHLVMNAEVARTCDACGGKTNHFVEAAGEDAPYSMVVCVADFFPNADECGDEITIH